MPESFRRMLFSKEMPGAPTVHTRRYLANPIGPMLRKTHTLMQGPFAQWRQDLLAKQPCQAPTLPLLHLCPTVVTGHLLCSRHGASEAFWPFFLSEEVSKFSAFHTVPAPTSFTVSDR